MFRINKADLLRSKACSLKAFEASAEGQPAISYPNGWTAEDTARVAKDKPLEFQWLVLKKLIPVTFPQAMAALTKAHGAEGMFREIRKFRNSPPA